MEPESDELPLLQPAKQELPDAALIQPNKTTPANGVDKPKKNKKNLIILVILLVAVAGLVVWILASKKSDVPSAKNQSTAQPAQQEITKKLIYAYKQGKTTTVRELDHEKGATKDLFSFEELNEITSSSEKFYAGLEPEVDLSPDGKTIAYIAADGLWTRDSDGGSPAQIIKATGQYHPDTGFTLYTFDPPFSPTVSSGPKGSFIIVDPTWSLDGSTIGFTVGHYEGSTVEAVNLRTKKYLSHGDTFRYAEFDALRNKFDIVAENKPFQDVGIFADYLLRPVYTAYSASYSKDKATAYAILCPKAPQLPGEDNDYRDCLYPGSKTVISVNLQDGSYKEIASGDFAIIDSAPELIVGDDEQIYIPVGTDNNSKVSAIDPKTGSRKDVDVLKSAGLAGDAKVLSVRVAAPQNPLATIYYQTGDKYAVSVVEVGSGKLVGTIDIARDSAFRPILLR